MYVSNRMIHCCLDSYIHHILRQTLSKIDISNITHLILKRIWNAMSGCLVCTNCHENNLVIIDKDIRCFLSCFNAREKNCNSY